MFSSVDVLLVVADVLHLPPSGYEDVYIRFKHSSDLMQAKIV